MKVCKKMDEWKVLPGKFPGELLPFVDKRVPLQFRPPINGSYYQPDEGLKPEYFFSHHLLDTSYCSDGAKRRFNEEGVRRYLVEKMEEERWVAEGNHRLSLMLERYLELNIERLSRLEEIRILDIGPSGGAITTLFALRALDKFGLLGKAKITLLDIVPKVIEMTVNGDFLFPSGAASDYGLDFAGEDGAEYKQMLAKAEPVVADFHEYVPQKKFHIILNGYTIHHLNVFDKIDCVRFMESVLEKGGAIGVVDFFVKTFGEYKDWLIAHLGKNPGSPAPIESPYFSREQIQSEFSEHFVAIAIADGLEKSWAMVMADGRE